jgi:hypothetical protein
VLFGFYLVFKFIAKEYINYVISAYFGLFGSLALFTLADAAVRYVLPKSMLPADPIVVTVAKASKGKWLLGELVIKKTLNFQSLTLPHPHRTLKI